MTLKTSPHILSNLHPCFSGDILVRPCFCGDLLVRTCFCGDLLVRPCFKDYSCDSGLHLCSRASRNPSLCVCVCVCVCVWGGVWVCGWGLWGESVGRRHR